LQGNRGKIGNIETIDTASAYDDSSSKRVHYAIVIVIVIVAVRRLLTKFSFPLRQAPISCPIHSNRESCLQSELGT